jgi:hypothetical protein
MLSQLPYAADFFRFEAAVQVERITIALDGIEYFCSLKVGCPQRLSRKC